LLDSLLQERFIDDNKMEEIKNMREFKRKLELLSILRGMQLRNEMTDVLLVSADCEIYVHSLVLALHPFWAGVLKEDDGNTSRMIFFPDYTEMELQQFVNEMYGNVTELEISGIPISKFLDTEAETKVRLQSLESLGLINLQITSLDSTEEESDFDFNNTIIQIQTDVGVGGNEPMDAPVLFETIEETAESEEMRRLRAELGAAKVKLTNLEDSLTQVPPVLVELPSERKSKRAPKKTKKGSILERALKAKKDGKIGKKTKGKKKAKIELEDMKLEMDEAEADNDVYHDDVDSGSDEEFVPDPNLLHSDYNEETGLPVEGGGDKASLSESLVNPITGKPRVPCDICNKTFDSHFGVKKHQRRRHNNEGHKCDRCGESFKTDGVLKKHIEEAHEAINKTCDSCNPSELFTINSLRKHIKTQHPDRTYCYKCNKTFVDKGHLLNHRKNCNSGDFVNCHICGMIIRRTSLATHVKQKHADEEVGPDGKIKCDLCPKEFNYHKRLVEHKKRVHDENRQRATCDKCGKTFTTVASLKAHEDIHSDMVYCCAACGKLYTCNRSLKTHMKEKHGNRKFICPICGRVFTHATSHARHIMVHTGEKPWKCDKCPLSFIRETRLRDHRLTHFDEKNYECDVCHMKFKNNAQRIKHSNVHKEKRYICNQCNYRCIQSMDLTKHYQKVHKMDRPKFTYLNYKPDEITIKTE